MKAVRGKLLLSSYLILTKLLQLKFNLSLMEKQKSFFVGLMVVFILGGSIFVLTRQKTQSESSFKFTAQAAVEGKNPIASFTNEQNLNNLKVISLLAENDSEVNGTASIQEYNGKTRIKLDLARTPADVSLPAHIHTGNCLNPGLVKYILTPPFNGLSETTLDVSYNEFIKNRPLSIGIHQPTDLNLHLACGNI